MCHEIKRLRQIEIIKKLPPDLYFLNSKGKN